MADTAEKHDSRPFHLLTQPVGTSPEEEKLRQLQAALSDTSGRNAAILVVDDTEALRKVVVLNLNALGYENVSEAKDGEVALKMLHDREYDLVVLDLNMPRLDGFGVLTALRNDPLRRHVPVVVASGLDQLDAIVRCIELGAEDFLPKPVNAVLLRARVGASLERKRLRDLERLRLLELQREKRLLEIEQEKSERLLLNILPAPIAERLKQGEQTIAERHAEVTVLFADIVEFTAFTNRTDAQVLVSLLNDLFSRFDRIAGRRGLEKIKTIGDCYLVAGGVPTGRADHATAVADMALEMLSTLAALNRERGTSIAMRIGIHSGPVVAGVIGSRKFTYDLWGATVNQANRMQSSGLPNRVNVSARTSELLQREFRLTERGTVVCKGIGEVRTYLLDGRINAAADSAPPV
ncbi:MAG TPA: adenylate/guanylate cyclase domain-containing protein [Opitutaceae bacterium]|nr:adenylate/guanylate cyclase domain-containing protein [Opitutaceae bacterium]